jgi:hypothetical protein
MPSMKPYLSMMHIVGGMADFPMEIDSNKLLDWRAAARLHIPAGILRIPVFSAPVALFSQES